MCPGLKNSLYSKMFLAISNTDIHQSSTHTHTYSRPSTVDDVVYQEEVIQVLRKSLETANLPHLLFYGPPGTGKTSTILAVAKQLFGPELFKDRVLELNASDERGIQVIRTKVKSFAQTYVSSQKPSKDYKYPCPPFKIIILDEADSMTMDAQAALRRTMEQYSNVTRFCLICNYVTRVIEPLTSRCAKFRFKPLDPQLILKRLQFISENEGLTVSQDTLEKIIEISEGDLRKAITTLQSANRIYGESIDKSAIIEISGIVPDELVAQFLDIALTSNNFNRMEQLVNELISHQGYSAHQIITQLNDILVKHPKISEVNKGLICLEISEVERKLLDGADEYLQLLKVGTTMMKLSSRTSCSDPMDTR
jgi:replication factor C subunit 2/4